MLKRRTRASDRIQGVDQAGRLEISLRDSAGLDLTNDDSVTVTSESGSITRKIRIEQSLGGGQIFVPTGFNGNEAMNLLALSDITKPGSPGWKTTKVQIEKV